MCDVTGGEDVLAKEMPVHLLYGHEFAALDPVLGSTRSSYIRDTVWKHLGVVAGDGLVTDGVRKALEEIARINKVASETSMKYWAAYRNLRKAAEQAAEQRNESLDMWQKLEAILSKGDVRYQELEVGVASKELREATQAIVSLAKTTKRGGTDGVSKV